MFLSLAFFKSNLKFTKKTWRPTYDHRFLLAVQEGKEDQRRPLRHLQSLQVYSLQTSARIQIRFWVRIGKNMISQQNKK